MPQVKEQNQEEKMYTEKELENEIAKATGNLLVPKNISDRIFNTLMKSSNENRLTFPAKYSLGNCLTEAYLIIQQNDKLRACTPESITQSMIDMAILGLNPKKQQCYFVPMGTSCTLLTSYFGKQAILKRVPGIKDIRADVIYEDTEYELFVDEYGNEDIKVLKPCPLKERKQEKIEGAWARIIMDEEVFGTESYVTIMPTDEIKRAHDMGNAKGNSKAHKDFFGEMAKKSVINRCVKNYINTMPFDNEILVETLDKVVGNEYSNEEAQQEYYVNKSVNINDVIDNDEVVVEPEKVTGAKAVKKVKAFDVLEDGQSKFDNVRPKKEVKVQEPTVSVVEDAPEPTKEETINSVVDDFTIEF